MSSRVETMRFQSMHQMDSTCTALDSALVQPRQVIHPSSSTVRRRLRAPQYALHRRRRRRRRLGVAHRPPRVAAAAAPVRTCEPGPLRLVNSFPRGRGSPSPGAASVGEVLAVDGRHHLRFFLAHQAEGAAAGLQGGRPEQRIRRACGVGFRV
jgi:hypothetical protein